MKGVYLLHFSSPLKHASHYVGYSKYIDQRIDHHNNCTGAKICKAAVMSGIELVKARVWEGKERDFERRVKNYKKTKVLCPICNPTANNRMKG